MQMRITEGYQPKPRTSGNLTPTPPSGGSSVQRRDLMSAILLSLVLGSCTNGQIDPQKVIDALKVACGIAVPAATVVAIINAGVGLTVQSVVDIICSGYRATVAAQGKNMAAGTQVEYDVEVNGKTIHVIAVKQ